MLFTAFSLRDPHQHLTDVSIELAEIDENLIRNELTVLERAEYLKRRKEIYEALHPETKQTTGRELAEKRWNATEIISPASFADDTAAKSGLTARTIRQDVQIASDISDDVKESTKGHPLAGISVSLRRNGQKPP